VDTLNIKNIFSKIKKTFLTIEDFIRISGDIQRNNLMENAESLEALGYTKSVISKSLSKADMNHLKATYLLLQHVEQ